MSFIQQIFFNLISIISLGLAGIIAVQNWETKITLVFLGTSYTDLSMGLIFLLVFVTGAAGVFFKLWNIVCKKQYDIKHFELRKEKAEVKAETATDQIRSLETKIKTLEKALEQTLSSLSSAQKNM